MILDPKLRQKTKSAQNALRQAEQDLVTMRQKFETQVRRLYIEGATVREIAAVLDLSHQRVHQLIGAKQTWWRRLTGQVEKPVRGCSYCGFSPKESGKLVAGPSVHICENCIMEASELMTPTAGLRRQNSLSRLADHSRQRCSFCGKRHRKIARVSANGHQICETCMELARDIIANEGNG